MLILTRRVGESLMIGDEGKRHSTWNQRQSGSNWRQRAKRSRSASRGDLPENPGREWQ